MRLGQPLVHRSKGLTLGLHNPLKAPPPPAGRRLLSAATQAGCAHTVAVLQAEERGDDAQASLLRVDVHVWLQAAAEGRAEWAGGKRGVQRDTVLARAGDSSVVAETRCRGGGSRQHGLHSALCGSNTYLQQRVANDGCGPLPRRPLRHRFKLPFALAARVLIAATPVNGDHLVAERSMGGQQWHGRVSGGGFMGRHGHGVGGTGGKILCFQNILLHACAGASSKTGGARQLPQALARQQPPAAELSSAWHTLTRSAAQRAAVDTAAATAASEH